MKRFIFLATILLLAIKTYSQSDSELGIWLSTDIKKKISKKWSLSGEAELRTTDGLSNFDRWSIGLQGNYTINRFLKADAGYVMIDNYKASKLTSTGKNRIESYWLMKHRFYTSLTAKWKFGNFAISLRERYQLTHNGEKDVAKYKVSTGLYNEDKTIEAKTTHLLRSKVELSYNIENSRFKPYASIELHNQLNGLDLEKSRLTLGSEIKLTKRQSIDFSYKYQKYTDADEPNGHIIGFGYSFSF